MKLNQFVAALIVAVFVAPAVAQDKAASAADPKSEVKSASKAPAARPHSHLEDRQGIVAAQPAAAQAQPMKKPLHNHARFHKQQ